MSRIVHELPQRTTPPLEAPETRKLGNYRHFMRTESQNLARNAYAYVNRRSRGGRVAQKVLLRKVLKDATFVPAHSTRFRPGFNVTKVEYFVVHRPGSSPPACTLLNLIREFTQEHSKASTQFGIGLNGELIQFVDLDDIAHHCGTGGTKNLVQDTNSVGVELEGVVGSHFTEVQLTQLARLISIIHDISGMPIDREHIVHHSAVTPRSRTDPGSNYPDTHVLGLARILPRVGDFYKAPFDIRQNAGEIAAKIAASASAPLSDRERGMLFAVSASVSSMARAAGMRFSGRGDTATWAAEQALQMEATQDYRLTEALLREQQLAQVEPTPQENVVSLLFDFTTGVWNDGSLT